MEEKRFYRLLCAILGSGSVLTLAHLAYAAWAYRYSSIVVFIAKELWP